MNLPSLSVPALAAVWLGIGCLGSVLGRWRRHRRLTAPCVPLALSLVTLSAAQVATSPGPLSGAAPGLGRPGAGLLVAATLALALCLLLADSLDGYEVLMVGAVGSAAIVLVSTGSALFYGLAALLAAVGVGIRWSLVNPGRTSLAGGRVPGIGGAALVAASAFLPVTDTVSLSGPRPTLAGGLLMAGVVAVLALVPVGGWAAGAMAGGLRAADIAPWLLLVAPAMLLTIPLIPAALPLSGRLTFQHGLLITGLASAIWAGIQAVKAPARTRYGRVVLGDLALVVAGVGSTQPVAVAGGLLLILTHLGAAPLMLQTPRAALRRPRLLIWVALSGLPPSPAFWGRFLILQGCAAANGQAALACLVSLGLGVLAAVLAVTRGEGGDAIGVGRAQLLGAWLAGLATAAIGLAPSLASRLVFGA